MVLLHKMLKGLAICTLGFILWGCEADVREECGGVGNLVSCLSIDNVQPSNINAEASSNVDAVANLCISGDAMSEPTAEPFGDHSANVTFSNRQFPDVSGASQPDVGGSLLVTIVNYSVSYTLNDCPPRAAACPALSGFTVSPGQTFTIPPNSALTQTFPFVPLRVKEEYVFEGGQTGSTQFGSAFPSYTANYVFTARTDFFSTDIQIEGSAEFTIGNFNLCSG